MKKDQVLLEISVILTEKFANLFHFIDKCNLFFCKWDTYSTFRDHFLNGKTFISYIEL